LQRLVGFALLAQDHEIVGIGHDTTAEADGARQKRTLRCFD